MKPDTNSLRDVEKKGEKMRRGRICWLASLLIGLIVATTTRDAQAVPSFQRQTGLSCFECHTVYPELTSVGRNFKLEGYVQSKKAGLFEWPPPLAGMVVVSLSHVNSRLPVGYFEDEWSNRILSRDNNVLDVPEEANLYYAGKLIDHVGAFVQGTFEGTSNTFHLDMTDIRFARSTSVGGKNLIYGLTLNNSPTLQDVWNSTPSWGFPFENSEVAPAPAAAAIIDGTLDQQVGGIGIYGLWNRLIYAEFSLYHTTHDSIFRPLGAGTKADMVMDDFAPYWRIAVEHQWGQHYLEAGTYGMHARIFPNGNGGGSTDRFTDIALDAQYQYLAPEYTLSVETTWIHEKQDWDGSYDLDITENRSDTLDTFRVNVDYYHQTSLGRVGGSAAYFLTTGDSDKLLYAPSPVDGSRNGSPDSNGFIVEANYLPIDKLRFAVQYVYYNKFNGGHSNYDGSGRDASDNNTLYVALTLLL